MNTENLIKNNKAASTDKITLKLYDLVQGKAIRQWLFSSGQKQYKLSVAGIRKGQYVLQASIANSQVSKQIIIE